MAVRDEFRRLLEREARLLDQLRYDDWLALYTAECVYWVPSTPNAGDPRREIAIMFDDRRRLEDRIYRCAPALPGRRRRLAHRPAGRHVEVFATAREDAFMLRSNF